MKKSYIYLPQELLEIRNNIILKRGFPALMKNRFTQSPFSTSWFGKNDLGDYSYEFCRLGDDSKLEFIEIYICKDDRWIQIKLNIFLLRPTIVNLADLNKVNGLKFALPPNTLTEMRLRTDDIKGIPLFNYHFMFGGHKLRAFHSQNELDKRVKELGDIIEEDMQNIDSFVRRWNELHQPNVTDWEGNRIT